MNIKYQIVMKCWKNDPDARTAFIDFRNQLKNMPTSHKEGSY